METIKSFQINHNILEPGFYLSRVDRNVFTYDMRFKKPNQGDYLPIAAMHTIEHLMATAVRNSQYKDNVVYFGPMGCRTGFYILFFDVEPEKAKEIVVDAIGECLNYDSVPGSKRNQCGNYRSHNLNEAKKLLSVYLSCLSESDKTHYDD